MGLRRYLARPDGTNDFVLSDMDHREYIKEAIQETFAKWGYRLLETPLLEYTATFTKGVHRGEEEQLYRMFDASGRTLSLRPEMTTPVARIVASTLTSLAFPLRLCYVAKTYRQQDGRTRSSIEMTQAGIELIGDRTLDADAEVIAVMANCLQTLGVNEFRLAIGHMGYVQAMLGAVPEDDRDVLREALIDKDLVRFSRTLQDIKASLPEWVYEALNALPHTRGQREAIERAQSHAVDADSLRACEELLELWSTLEAHGVAEYIHIDLGLYLNYEYYTGVVIEGYADSLGQPICFGGRYDRLLEEFGRQASATGCVLHLERLMEIVQKKPTDRKLVTIWYERSMRETALSFSRFLRNLGYNAASSQLVVMDQRHIEDEETSIEETCIFDESGEFRANGSKLLSLYQDFIGSLDQF